MISNRMQVTNTYLLAPLRIQNRSYSPGILHYLYSTFIIYKESRITRANIHLSISVYIIVHTRVSIQHAIEEQKLLYFKRTRLATSGVLSAA